MKITSIIQKILYALGAALIVVFILLCITIAAKNRNIKTYKETIANQEQTISEQKEMITKLANMEAVRCEVAITVKNTAVMGSTKSGDIQQDAKQIASYLRGELLEEIRR